MIDSVCSTAGRPFRMFSTRLVTSLVRATADYTLQDSKGTVAGDKTFAWNIAENVAA